MQEAASAVAGCNRVCFTEQAYLSVVAESKDFPDRETGGIFLGHVVGDTWYVVESIDPGYQNIHRSVSFFEYDEEYVNHLANVRARLYEHKLQLLGLWHRHPGSFDSFSSTDDGTNQRFSSLQPRGAISALVNFDPDFRFTLYHVMPSTARRPHYRKLDPSQIEVGNELMPPEFLTLKDPEDYQLADQETAATEALLDIVTDEVAGLENPDDYEVELNRDERAVEIHLAYLGDDPKHPSHVLCLFYIESAQVKFAITDQLTTYHGPYYGAVINSFLRGTLGNNAMQSPFNPSMFRPVTTGGEVVPPPPPPIPIRTYFMILGQLALLVVTFFVGRSYFSINSSLLGFLVFAIWMLGAAYVFVLGARMIWTPFKLRFAKGNR